MDPTSENDPRPAERSKQAFEHEKWAIEVDFRRQELELKKHEQRRTDAESKARLEELRRSRWSSPLVLAVIGAALAAGGNAGVSLLNGWAQRQLEEDRAKKELARQTENHEAEQKLELLKAEAARLLEVIRTNDPDKAAVNLQFLLDTHLITREDTRFYLQTFLANRTAGEGPALPSPSSVPILGRPGPGGAALGSYNAVPNEVSVSGLSAGAFMAVQLATTFSSSFKGVGVIAGGPFGCSEGELERALTACLAGIPPLDLSRLIANAQALAERQAIDPLENISRQKVYVFHGMKDSIINRNVVDVTVEFYRKFLRTDNLVYENTIQAGHGFVTKAYGDACGSTGGDFIIQCDYDLAGAMLQHIYGTLTPHSDGPLRGRMITFDQGRYTTRDPESYNLGDTGYVYLPEACALGEPCRVHVVLHGCRQDRDTVGDLFVRNAGYNEWADNNRIIVLYPQSRRMTINPAACWDWWGFTSNPGEPTSSKMEFLTRDGRQMAAVMAMVRQVTANSRLDRGRDG